MRRWAAVVIAVMTVGCVGGEGGSTQEIIGGTPVPARESGWVFLELADGTYCTATLLANSWILTAKHCGAAHGDRASMGDVDTTVDRVFDHPTLDVTLARLTHPLGMYGQWHGWQRPLRRTALPVGAFVSCFGYGRTTFGGGGRVLTTAVLRISSNAGTDYHFLPNAAGQIQWRGDSGGGCFNGGDALVVVSTCRATDPDRPDGTVYECQGTRSDVIAEWADRIMYFGERRLAHGNACFAGDDCRLGDVDGDGDDDLVNFAQDATGFVWVALSNGTHTFRSSALWAFDFCTAGRICRLADADGDGRDDALAFDRTTGAVYVARSNGSAFGVPELWNTGACYDNESCEVGDVDADGRDDVIAFSPTGDVWVVVSNGNAFVVDGTVHWHTGFCAGASAVCKVADVDGDGDADVIEFTRGAAGDVYVAHSTRLRFGARTRWHDWFCVFDEICETGDIDGDGLADLVTFPRGPSGDVWAAVSDRHSFVGTGWKWHDLFCIDDWTCLTGDVNGDGRTDLVAATSDASADVWVALSQSD